MHDTGLYILTLGEGGCILFYLNTAFNIILFGVFNQLLKCPHCGEEMKSHVDMKKKHRHAHYISLQCVACDRKYCFNTSIKQRQSYEVIAEQS